VKLASLMSILAMAASLVSAAPAGAETSGEQRAQAAGRIILGTPAPRLILTTIDGDTIDLRSLYGKKAVYLKFWATWCVPCRQQMPHFEHAYETAGPDMAVIAIDVGFNDSIEAVRDYRKKLGITMPVVFDDGHLDAAFHVRVTPTHILIGRDGRIRYVGHLADHELDAALVAARTEIPTAASDSPRNATAGASEGKDPPPIGVGDRLPPWSLRTLDGHRFELRHGSSKDQLTALVFLSPWCESYLATTRPEVSAGCRSAREQIGALSSDPHIRWLGIASGLWANRDDLRSYRAQYKLNIPLTLDETGAEFRAFRVNNVPTILIADGTGKILRRIDGGTTRDVDALRKMIDGSGGSGT
jgi:thiol-disulfide isomerase/thioredoxin